MLIRLLFKQEEAQYIVNNEGLDAIDKMGCLDDEMLDHMCKSCRKAPVLLYKPPAQATSKKSTTRWTCHLCDPGKCLKKCCVLRAIQGYDRRNNAQKLRASE